MSASLEDIEDSLFEDSSFDEKVTRFASDSGCQVVYITKETFIDVDDDCKLKVLSYTDDRQFFRWSDLPTPSSPYTPSFAFHLVYPSTYQDVTNT